uniref:Putative sodium-coupled neutral amino acid transporter 11 n=1 Tax=Strigamia maritima TaxID=126957 RepID=T1JHR5_STRMM
MTNANEKSYILQDVKPPPPTIQQTSPEGETVFVDDTKQLVSPDNKTDENNAEEEVSSMPYASFNYINSIIGSGVIAMPYALSMSGFWLGIILLILVAIITDYSLIIMVKGGHLSQTNSYQGLVEAAFGRPGFYILSFLQCVYPVIGMISYNVIISDTITKILVRITKLPQTSILGNRKFVVILSTLLITLPLSLLRKMSKLAKISFISLIFILFILIVLLIRAGTLGPKIPPTENAWEFANAGVMQAIGIMSFAFMCHHNAFLLYSSLENPTQARWNKVTHASIIASFILLVILGVTGYATFTGLSQGDVLENFCLDDDLINVIRLFFALTVMLTFPIECFVCREVIENVFFINYTKPQSFKVHYITTVSIVAVTVVISMATDCLGIVLELNGILTAVPLAYILPGLSYLKLEDGSIFSTKKLPALLTAFFGIIVAMCGLITTILRFPESEQCSHGAEMEYCRKDNASLSFDSTLQSIP